MGLLFNQEQSWPSGLLLVIDRYYNADRETFFPDKIHSQILFCLGVFAGHFRNLFRALYYIHTPIQTLMLHIYTYAYLLKSNLISMNYVCLSVCESVCLCLSVCLSVSECVFEHVFVCLCLSMCLYVCLSECVSVFL